MGSFFLQEMHCCIKAQKHSEQVAQKRIVGKKYIFAPKTAEKQGGHGNSIKYGRKCEYLVHKLTKSYKIV